MGEKEFDWTYRIPLQLDKTKVDDIVKYLLVEPSASQWGQNVVGYTDKWIMTLQEFKKSQSISKMR